MPVHDNLGTRMKENYENVSKTRLVKRMPVAIRIDGKAFHTFTKGFSKPFDDILVRTMQETMQYLCKNIQGCVFGYTQSDEITLILKDYAKLETSAWFDYEVQKLCSITASMATLYFNKNFEINVENWYKDNFSYNTNQQNTAYQNAICRGAMFDARCFNIPREEVANLIYWRQLDAVRNSVQMVGHANFSQKELQGKNCDMIQDMLLQKKGINWNDYPTDNKRGSCCIKNYYNAYNDELVYPGKFGEWVIDKDIPIFQGEENRYYIEKFLLSDDEKNEIQKKRGIV